MASHPTLAHAHAHRWRTALVVLVVVAVAGWFGWRRWFAPGAPVTFTTTAVTRGTLTRSVTASGTLQPVEVSTVGSQVSGRLTEVLVDYNDHVTKGQVLARIDPRVLTSDLAQTRARLQAA